VEEAAVEVERLVDVADLERDVVDAEEPGLFTHPGIVPSRGDRRAPGAIASTSCHRSS